MQIKLLLLILGLATQILLPITGGIGGPSGVIFNNSCSAVGSSATSLSCSLSAVSGGAVAIGLVHSSPPTGVSCTVGGTAATAISGSAQTTTIGGESFGLATGATTGSIAVSCNWTGGIDSALGAISVSGANQTTPFINGNVAAAGSGNPTLVITSAPNHLTFSVGFPSTMPTANSQTAFFTTQIPFGAWVSGQYGAGAATVTHSWTNGGTSLWVVTGTDIQP